MELRSWGNRRVRRGAGPWPARPSRGIRSSPPPLVVRDGPAGRRLDRGTRPCEEVVGVSEGQSSAQAPAGGRAPVGRPMLSLTLAAMMDEVHAHSGAVYLLSPDQPVL